MSEVSSNTIDDLVSSTQTMTIRVIPQNYPTMYYHKNKDHILSSQKGLKKKSYDELKDHKTHCDICNVDIHPVNWTKHTATARHQRGGGKVQTPPPYYCSLCDKTVNYRTKKHHLTSKKHIALQEAVDKKQTQEEINKLYAMHKQQEEQELNAKRPQWEAFLLGTSTENIEGVLEKLMTLESSYYNLRMKQLGDEVCFSSQ